MASFFCAFVLLWVSFSFARNEQFIFDVGNDFFTLPRHTDRYLTNNISLGIAQEGLPRFLSAYQDEFIDSVKLVTAFALSHYMYTPEDTSLVLHNPEDQPYAGWLFFSTSLGVRNQAELFLYEVQVGVVGPSAKGEELQNFYHELIGVDKALGWDHQLHDELGLNLVFNYGFLAFRSDPQISAWGGDFVYGGGASLGNVDTHLELIALTRWGYNVPDDMGYRVGNRADLPWCFYGFLRGQQRLVVRDIFLDGNTDGNSASVEKRNLLSLGSVGASVGYKGLEISYSFDAGTKRFKTQSSVESRGSFSLSYLRAF